MSFNTSLSGLNGASADLNVTGNNIANASTTGFKRSRAEFGDIYAISNLGSTRTAIGSGVLLNQVAQQFNQGNLEFTENTLDLAVSGQGFFVLTPNLTSEEPIYTRAGAFGVDNDGYVVNSAGQYLRTFPVNDDGTVTSTSLASASALRLPDSAGTPQASATVDISVNLPSDAPDLDPALFDPTDSTTFTNSTSVTVFDSLGNSHIATIYYMKTDSLTNSWESRVFVDGNALTPDGAETLSFDTAGALTTPAGGQVGYTAAPYDPSNGAEPIALTFDYSQNTTQFSAPFAVNALSQDGRTTGRLSGLDIDDTGVVRANFTNGLSLALGKIALAQFRNPQGLRQLGNTAWAQTLDSGEALGGEAGTSSFGSIRAGALETSNVDLTQELVHLITAQRNFQANARAIETESTVTQTIINIR
jgi:flagellar hook protein FlgE